MQDIRINFVTDTSGLTKAERALENLTKEEKEVAEGLKKIARESDKTSKDFQNNFKGASSAIKGVGGALLGAFALDSIVSFGKKVLDITGQFQRLEAVLTNTLGSKSKAQAAMAQIQEFAAKTPFSVAQLTESFVKLANAGFVPTTNQLRQLGDLASSTGKDFDQLAEAIIDAQTGEFERLKEFGIRAQKEGDNVKFTFKGVETQVKNTSEAITGYITSLGDLEGVTGSMAAISGTLDGQISNLGDSFDKLFLTIGSQQGSVFSNFIGFVNEGVNALTRLISTSDQIAEQNFLKVLGAQAEETKKRIEDLAAVNVKLGQTETEAKINAIKQIRVDLEQNILSLNEQIFDLTEKSKEQLGEQKERTFALIKEKQNDLKIDQERLDSLNKINTELTKAPPVAKKTTDEIKQQNKLLKEQQDLLKAKGDKSAFALLTEDVEKTTTGINLASRAIADLNSSEAIDRQADSFARLQEMAQRLAGGFGVPDLGNDEQLRAEEDKEARIMEIRQRGYDFAVDLTNSLFELQSQKRDADLMQIQSKQESELAMVGDNQQAQDFIRKKYADEERRVKAKQAQSDKAQAMFNIIISTAMAVAKANPVIPLMALAAATGALQLGLVAARPIPKFARGTEYLTLNGNKKGTDTILMYGDEGERILPKDINRQIDPRIKNFQVPRLIKLGQLVANNTYNNDPAIVQELQMLRGDFKNQPKNEFHFDEHGISKYYIGQNLKKKILNKQFSRGS